MHKRPMWMRLAALAIVLALASPVWASEMQMRKKEDPKAEQKQDASEQKTQDPAKGAEQKKVVKDNCSIDIMSFNTLEDMYGFLGTVDSLTLQQKQQAEQAKLQAAANSTATQGVEWRTVEQPQAKKDGAEKKQDE